MNKSYQEPNLTMLTDFYELTMANGYFVKWATRHHLTI